MTTPHTPTPAERAEELAFQMSVYADNDMHIPLPLFREWEAAVEAADTLDQLQANLADARNEGDWTGAKFIELDLLAFCEKHGIDLNAPVEVDEEEAPAPAPLKFSVPPRLYTGRLDDPGIGEFTLSDGYSDQVVGFIGTYEEALGAYPGHYPYLRQIPTP